MRHCPNSVSWTSNDVPYYVHRVDRSKIEKYYAMLKNPALRQESSRKSSAQSSRNNSRESSVFREKDHRNGHRNHQNGASNGEDYACGPTTRRKWNDYISELDQKKKRKGGEGSCRDADPYVGTSNQYDSDDDADHSPSSMGSPNSQSGRKPKKQAKREGSAAKNGRGRPPKGGKSASEKADRSSKSQRLSAEAKEGIELMHQMSCAVSRGEDPAKLISDMTAAKRQAAFGNGEAGPVPDRPTGLLPVPFPDVQLPLPDVTVNMVKLADPAIPSKYENLEAFLKDLRVLYESFLDSLHAPEFIHRVLQNNAEKAQSSSCTTKVIKTEPSTSASQSHTLVNGHADHNAVDQALIASSGFMEASERIINYHQRIHAKLADLTKDIEACSQEMTRLHAMKREAEERVRTEQHQKQLQKQQQEQSHQNLLRMMCSAPAQQPPAGPVFSPTADPNQMLLAELAKHQQQLMNQQNPLSQLMPYMDLASLQAVTASLGLTQQLGGNPSAQMQHPSLQQQIAQLLGQQFGIDLTKIGGDVDLSAALQNAAMSLATGMPSTIPTSSNGVSSQLLPPTLGHIPALSAAAAVASQMSPIAQHVQPSAPPPPQQQRLPANIQATPTSSSAVSGACSALPYSFSAAQQQQQSQYASAADGAPAPVSKKSRSRPSRSSGSKKNGVKEEGDPKHEEELEKQVQSIVKTALEVDQRAKSAEKDRKSRSSEKRKDKTPQQPPLNQTSGSDSTPQSLDLNSSADSRSGPASAPLPSPLLPPTISLPSAFTASSASTNTLTCLTSPITPTSTIGSGDMFPMPTSKTNSSSSAQLNFVPCSISLAISTNTLAKVESGAAASAELARSLNGNGGSAAYRQ
ncbi:histone-lysine N-methyltransferase [Aphelenchoides avenae]|nr:histone-lysine N-methyltransferase [Aphelenchus avenae]